MNVMFPFASPLDEQTFARLMQAVGPFERRPRIAVAVSGGPDSMALCGLMVRWMRCYGGETVALTVDHLLRPESSHEARLVSERLARLGVTHHILTRTGPPLEVNIQAEARAARYQILEEWCLGEGVLHLALAHHQDDQAATVLLRLARGSGLRGLAAMAPVVYRRNIRVVRPLLTVTRACLKATCIAHGLVWTDDKSNHNENFSRVRMRRLFPLLQDEGIETTRLSATARSLARAGLVVRESVAILLAKSADIHPFGFARLDPRCLRGVPIEVALRALSFLLKIVSGRTYPPRLRQLEELHMVILAQAMHGGRALAGCLVRPFQGGLLLCREPAAVAMPKPVTVGEGCLRWDGRFLIITPRTVPTGLKVGALGKTGWREISAARPAFTRLPSRVGWTLPALHAPNGHINPLLPVGHANLAERDSVATTTAVFAPDAPE